MSTYLSYEGEDKNRNIGLLISTIFHLLLTLLFFVIFISSGPEKKEDVSAIEIVFENAELKIEEEELSPTPTIDQPKINEQKEQSVTPVQQPSSTKPTSSKPSNNNSKTSSNVPSKTETPSSSETEAQTNQDEAAIIAAEEKAERERKIKESKGKFSSVIGSTKSNSSGNDELDNTEGNNELDNITIGKASVKEGLDNRKVLYEPVINENSQKAGVVAVKICINEEGKVISSKFTQKGSTTTDSYLVKIAEKAGKKYIFSKAGVEEQCGNIIIEFKLK